MRASADAISEKLDELFSINNETSLTAEITTIIDELNCIDFLSGQQQDVLSSLTRAQSSRKFSNRSLQQVCEMVKERRDAWANIERTARRMYGDLRHQIDLKQKQANISEARSSRRQAEASARHGRIILLFTVVTIIFLPMSFLASWFGMNAKGINSGSNIPVGIIAAIIFPISITIALFALVLAFSERMRNLIVEIAQRIIDFVFGATGVSRSRRRRRRERMSEQEQRMLQMRNFEQDEALR
jgi:Mg2+ and Co2+ transporter CorA